MKIKKVLKIIGWALLVFFTLIIIASAIVYFKRDAIYNEILAELNQNKKGETEIEKIKVAPFKNFPYISIDLKNTRVYSSKDKLNPRDTIIDVSDIYVGFNLYDLMKGEYAIKKIKIHNGFLHMRKDSFGTINLVEAFAPIHEDDDTTSESHFHLDLQKISLKNILFKEVNEYSNKYLEILFQDAATSFSDIKTLVKGKLEGSFELKEYSSEGITYFRDKPFKLSANIEYNEENGIVSIPPGKLTVEAGSIDFEGSIDTKNDFNVNIEISGKKKNFDLFISFTPEDVYEKLKKFKNEGDIYFKGLISGPTVNQSPAIDFELGCSNTSFFSVENRKALKDINFVGKFTTGENNNLETSEFELKQLYGVPESGYFKGVFKVKNFINPIISMDFHARLDLEHLKTFYDFEWLEQSKGRVEIDITLNEFVGVDSLVHAATKLNDGTNSRIAFKNVMMKLKDYPNPIKNINGKIELDGDDVKLTKLSALVKESDINLSMNLKNVTSYFHHYDALIDFEMHGESKKITVKDIIPPHKIPQDAIWKDEVISDLVFDIDLHAQESALENFEFLPTSDFYIRKLQMKLKNYDHELKHFYGKLNLSDDFLNLEKLNVVLGRNNLKCTANVKNPSKLLASEGMDWVDFYADIQSDYFNAKELLIYQNKTLLSKEIDDQFEEEIIKDFEFEGSGKLLANSFSDKGFMGVFDIKTFKIQLNDLPALGKTSGHFDFDTFGNIKLSNFATSLGKSDLNGSLFFRQVMQSDTSIPKYIKGSLSSKLLDIDNLTSYQGPPVGQAKGEPVYVDHDSGFNIFVLPFPIAELEFKADKINYHKYLLSKAAVKLRSDKNHYIHIDTLEFEAAGGHVAMSGYLNGSNKDQIYSAMNVSLKNIDMNQLFYKLDNFGQDYLIQDNVSGRITTNIKARMRLHTDLTVDMSDAMADIDLLVKDGYLKNFAPMHAMAEFLGNKNFDNIRFGELENTLSFKNGKLFIPKMQINSSLGYIRVSGRQNMDFDMEYEVQVPVSLIRQAGWHMVKSKLSLNRKNKNSESEIEEAEQEIVTGQSGLLKGYMTFTILGNSEDFEVKLGKRKSKD